MLGLESWIPNYMTGQVTPYYLKEVKNSIYCHLNYVSASAALTGECIKGFHDKGKYYLTVNNKEINYYKEKANLLIKKANPLMNIYREENFDNYKIFLLNSAKINCERKRILSSLPLFTIKKALLIKMLKRNNINNDDINKILLYKEAEEKNIKSVLKNNVINDIIHNFNENDFDQNIYLSLDNIFYNQKVKYTYKEYLEHFNSTIEYSKKIKNYIITTNFYRTFKNINVTILKNNYVVISKNSDPVIHFVIKHPKLVNAIENFYPIVKE